MFDLEITGGMIVAVVAGVASWTLLEYLIHRWMGHDRRFKRTPFGIEHVRHHIEGDYFAPTWKKAIIVPAIAAVLGAPLIAIAGATAGIAYLVGLLGFYTVYEVLHRREHTHPGVGWYGRWARRHHFHHHFVDGRKNHGVTTPIWDFVFGTYERPTIIRVPRKLCMAWLLDPATGEVRSDHAATYRLRSS
jgi:sterol desaturase/sphingolipid hydroxylase (fatty acid hydroxylase superfamily)